MLRRGKGKRKRQRMADSRRGTGPIAYQWRFCAILTVESAAGVLAGRRWTSCPGDARGGGLDGWLRDCHDTLRKAEHLVPWRCTGGGTPSEKHSCVPVSCGSWECSIAHPISGVGFHPPPLQLLESHHPQISSDSCAQLIPIPTRYTVCTAHCIMNEHPYQNSTNRGPLTHSLTHHLLPLPSLSPCLANTIPYRIPDTI